MRGSGCRLLGCGLWDLLLFDVSLDYLISTYIHIIYILFIHPYTYIYIYIKYLYHIHIYACLHLIESKVFLSRTPTACKSCRKPGLDPYAYDL